MSKNVTKGEVKQFMRQFILDYPKVAAHSCFDELDLAIEAQAEYGLTTDEPDCAFPPYLLDLAKEVLDNPPKT